MEGRKHPLCARFCHRRGASESEEAGLSEGMEYGVDGMGNSIATAFEGTASQLLRLCDEIFFY